MSYVSREIHTRLLHRSYYYPLSLSFYRDIKSVVLNRAYHVYLPSHTKDIGQENVGSAI